MWKNAFALLVVLIVGCFGAKDSNPLQAMLTRIQQQKCLSASSIGNNATWNYLAAGLFMGNISNHNLYKYKKFVGVDNQLYLDSIKGNLTSKNGNYELFIAATGTVWGHNVGIDITFVYTSSSQLEAAIQFIMYETKLPLSAYGGLQPNAQGWFTGWSLVGKNQAIISTTSFTDLMGRSFQSGLTIIANVASNSHNPIQQQLANLMHVSTNAIEATITVRIPVSGSDPLASLTAVMDTPLYFGPNSGVKATELTLQVDVQIDLSVTASLTSNVYVEDGANTMEWIVKADVSEAQGFIMTGTLQGSWNHTLGLKWLQLQQVVFTITAEVTPQVTTQFSFTANAVFSFLGSDSPIATLIVLGVDSGMGEFAFQVQMSLSTLEKLFDAVIGQQPPDADQVYVQGQLQVVIATYNYNGNRPGLTVSGNAFVAGSGSLASAIQEVTKQPLAFTFNFYSPIFTSTPQDIDFSLSETDPITITNAIEMLGFTIEFSIEPNPLVSFTTTINMQISTNPVSTLQFAPVTASVGTNQPLEFSGNFKGDLQNANFGLKWLDIKSLTVDIVFNNNAITSGTIAGDVEVTFGDATTELQVTLSGPDFSDFSITLNVLVPDMSKFLTQTMPSSQPPALTSEISLMGMITIANFGAQPGLTFNGQAIIEQGGKLANAIKAVDPSSTYQYTILLYLPIWSQNPPEVKFSVTETGLEQITPKIELNGYSLTVEIMPDPSISITTSGNITIDHNPQPLSFSLDGAVGVDNSVMFTLSGQMTGVWQDPFGFDWITITSLSVDIQFQNGVFQQLEFSGSAKFDFSTSQDAVAIAMASGPTPGDVMFEAKDISVVSLSAAAAQVYNKAIQDLNDVTSISNSLTVIISTYDTQDFASGLTFVDNVTITGDLLQKLKIFNGVNTAIFDLGLSLPLFSEVPDVKFFLKTSGFQIKPTFRFTGVTIILDTDPFSISVDTGFICEFSNNPQLEFDIDGSFSVDGSITLAGDMLGTWDNVFGIKGFNVANVMAAIGMNPQLCGVDLCISALGLGFNMSIGTEQIGFYGYAEIPELEHILLDTSITGPNGLALSFRDVALQWNKLVGANSPVHIDVNDIPANWGLEDLFFYIAPVSGTYGGKYYEQGFWFEGGFSLIGIVCQVVVKVTDNDFEFEVHLTVDQFVQAVNNELQKQQQQSSVQVTNVTITNFSAAKLANGVVPKFTMEYELFGSHQLNVGLGFIQLAEDFNSFFKQYLQNIFG